MRLLIGILLAGLFVSSPLFAEDTAALPKPSAQNFQKRCGWLDQPTPGNLWLTDKDGQWTIGTQGTYRAEGDLPRSLNGKDYWVNTNGDYGYGCTCLRVKVDRADFRILEIQGGQTLPLKKCATDKNIPPRTP